MSTAQANGPATSHPTPTNGEDSPRKRRRTEGAPPSRKQVTAILLDIEGTTTPISFVHDVLFPYASKHLESFLSSNEDVAKECIELVKKDGQTLDGTDALIEKLWDDITHDRKTKALKHLQGLLWKGAYESGEIKGVVYPDVVEALHRWRDELGLGVYIYSSGSVAAQKLLFGYSDQGDLLSLFDGHFDLTTTGSKQEASSYASIAKQVAEGEPSRVLFVSDNPLESKAAIAAGIRTLIAVRPGNAALKDTDKALAPLVESFAAVDAVL